MLGKKKNFQKQDLAFLPQLNNESESVDGKTIIPRIWTIGRMFSLERKVSV